MQNRIKTYAFAAIVAASTSLLHPVELTQAAESAGPAAVGPTATAPSAFPLQDGDRVVMLGNTFIERQGRYGYLETILTARYPKKHIVFRNLAWSGDTVLGHAQSYFGPPKEGFDRRLKFILANKPSVILVNFGAVAAFDGEPGLPSFLDGLGKLLDTLKRTNARIVLLAPPPMERLAPPLPDPTEQNQRLARYRDALMDVAKKRKLGFVDLYSVLNFDRDAASGQSPKLIHTDNGLHFTGFGYWRAAPRVMQAINQPLPRWSVKIDVKKKSVSATGAIVKAGADPMRFTLTDAMLPTPLPPAVDGKPTRGVPTAVAAVMPPRVVQISGLESGTYALTVAGKVVAQGSSQQWQAGVHLTRGPSYDQAEQLRQAILEKNLLYFHRWRPANETYLHGFRKHEQGNNAVEIPRFEGLVAAVEKRIAKLRAPVPHMYEIRKIENGTK